MKSLERSNLIKGNLLTFKDKTKKNDVLSSSTNGEIILFIHLSFMILSTQERALTRFRKAKACGGDWGWDGLMQG